MGKPLKSVLTFGIGVLGFCLFGLGAAHLDFGMPSDDLYWMRAVVAMLIGVLLVAIALKIAWRAC